MRCEQGTGPVCRWYFAARDAVLSALSGAPARDRAWRRSDWLVVAAVAQRLLRAGLAAAKINRLAFGGAVFHRGEATAAV